MTFDMNNPGTYEVSTGADKKTKVEADSFRYTAENDLEALKGGQVVGVWRWWESVVRTGD